MAGNRFEGIELRPARFGKSIRQGFVDIWDHLGLVIAISLLWSAAVAVPLGVGITIGSSASVVIGGIVAWLLSTPLLAGVFRVAYLIALAEGATFGDMLEGTRELALPSYALSAMNLAVAAVLGADVFVLFRAVGVRGLPILVIPASMLTLYMCSGWAVLVAQKPLGQRRSAFQAFKRSWLLVLGAPGFTIGLFIAILGVGILCAITRVGMLILYAGVTAILLSHGLRALYVRYGVIEKPEEADNDD